MKNYKSKIDGHPISVKPLPKSLNDLVNLKMQGSLRALKSMPQTKTVRINGDETVFILGKDFEYYSGRLSLTKYLQTQRNTGQLTEYATADFKERSNNTKVREHLIAQRNANLTTVEIY